MRTSEMLGFVENQPGNYCTVLGTVYSVIEPFTSKYSIFNWWTAQWLLFRARPNGIIIVHDRLQTPSILTMLLPELILQYHFQTLSDFIK